MRLRVVHGDPGDLDLEDDKQRDGAARGGRDPVGGAKADVDDAGERVMTGRGGEGAHAEEEGWLDEGTESRLPARPEALERAPRVECRQDDEDSPEAPEVGHRHEVERK